MTYEERVEDLEVLRERIEAGEVTLVVGRTFPLAEAAEAIRFMHDRAPAAKSCSASGRVPSEDPSVDAAELRRWCLAQSGAVEDFVRPRALGVQGGRQDVRAERLEGTPLEVSAKCEPELALHLRDTYSAIRPGYHLNKRHWNTITLDGSLSDHFVRELIADSYDLVVSALPKRTREELVGAGSGLAASVQRGARR